MIYSTLFSITLWLALCTGSSAFAPSTTGIHQQHLYRPTVATTMHAVAPVPNPFKNLPWNVRKEKERQARRLKQGRAQLYRELGIAEDATYEEIVDATNALLTKAGNDMKQKVKIEMAKDKILQIRLNERLAGLAATNKEARAQSNFEVEG